MDDDSLNFANFKKGRNGEVAAFLGNITISGYLMLRLSISHVAALEVSLV